MEVEVFLANVMLRREECLHVAVPFLSKNLRTCRCNKSVKTL